MYKLLANNFTVVKHLYSNVAICTVRGEHTVCNCTKAIIAESPADSLFGKLCGRTCSVNTLNNHGCRGCRCIIIILGIKNSVVELTRCFCLRYDNYTVDGSTLRTIGRDRTHYVLTFTLTLRNESRRSASVTVYCVYTSEREHHFTHLIVRKTGRNSSVTSVNLTEYQSSVCFDTDHRTRSVGRRTLYRL